MTRLKCPVCFSSMKMTPKYNKKTKETDTYLKCNGCGTTWKRDNGCLMRVEK